MESEEVSSKREPQLINKSALSLESGFCVFVLTLFFIIQPTPFTFIYDVSTLYRMVQFDFPVHAGQLSAPQFRWAPWTEPYR